MVWESCEWWECCGWREWYERLVNSVSAVDDVSGMGVVNGGSAVDGVSGMREL